MAAGFTDYISKNQRFEPLVRVSDSSVHFFPASRKRSWTKKHVSEEY